MIGQPEIVITKDGSPTLFLPEYREHYHSIHGALQESKHIFIENGVKRALTTPIYIFEMGFGTGLNAALTFQYAQTHKKKIIYHAIEKYPINQNIVNQLNFDDYLKKKINHIHNLEWNKEIKITPYFHLQKIKADILTFNISTEFYHCIYFDAFAPRVQPELWSEGVINRLYRALRFNGFLVTYCAKGEIKRRLKKAGFKVSALPGPPGKREMTLAEKI